jgi:hypothetical protein
VKWLIQMLRDLMQACPYSPELISAYTSCMSCDTKIMLFIIRKHVMCGDHHDGIRPGTPQPSALLIHQAYMEIREQLSFGIDTLLHGLVIEPGNITLPGTKIFLQYHTSAAVPEEAHTCRDASLYRGRSCMIEGKDRESSFEIVLHGRKRYSAPESRSRIEAGYPAGSASFAFWQISCV